jgi:cell division ATPase FtsA
LPGGVVLTGGTAKLPGIAEFAKEKLQLPARLGKLQGVTGIVDTVSDSSYFTVVGLMLLDMLLLPEQFSNGHGGAPNSKAMGIVDGIMKRFRR